MRFAGKEGSGRCASRHGDMFADIRKLQVLRSHLFLPGFTAEHAPSMRVVEHDGRNHSAAASVSAWTGARVYDLLVAQCCFPADVRDRGRISAAAHFRHG